MGFGEGAGWIGVVIQIFFVDLLLGADNALIIGLACRSLAPEDARAATFLGAGGAIVLRLALTAVATSLLGVPLIKLAGAWVLIVIALNVVAERRPNPAETGPVVAVRSDLWSAALAIVAADAAMSLDNVVALAAIANGNFWVLLAGVAFSIPIIAYGGLIFVALLRNAPDLIALGAALLGWVAGEMAVSDPLVADWANVNAPALVAVAPALAAAFVWLNRRPAARVAAPSAPGRAASQAALAPSPPRPARVAALPARPKLVARPMALDAPVDEPAEPNAVAPQPASADDRIAVIGVLILAVIAGVALMLVSYIDSLN
jgi:YjbE family integral membrane protein